MKGRRLKRLRFINEWKNFEGFGFFQTTYTQINIVIGKVALFSLDIGPGLLGTLYISVVILGFGFSLLVGTSRNKDIFR